jgi:hypothetical protein
MWALRSCRGLLEISWPVADVYAATPDHLYQVLCGQNPYHLADGSGEHLTEARAAWPDADKLQE